MLGPTFLKQFSKSTNASQNQLQKLRSEELHRQQTPLQRMEEEEESGNSAASSPCLRHKGSQSERYV